LFDITAAQEANDRIRTSDVHVYAFNSILGRANFQVVGAVSPVSISTVDWRALSGSRAMHPIEVVEQCVMSRILAKRSFRQSILLGFSMGTSMTSHVALHLQSCTSQSSTPVMGCDDRSVMVGLAPFGLTSFPVQFQDLLTRPRVPIARLTSARLDLRAAHARELQTDDVVRERLSAMCPARCISEVDGWHNTMLWENAWDIASMIR
jgi:hypothetical protein